MKKLILISFLLFVGSCGFGQNEIDTAEYKSYENGVYRIMQIQTVDLEMNPIEYSFTYYYTSDGTFMCNLPKCRKTYRPGVLKIESFSKQKKEGEEKEYYRCEVIEYPYKCPGEFRLKSKGKWRNGKENGKWKFFHKNGTIESFMTYRNGKKHGKYIRYTSDGRIIATAKYNNDVLIESTEYLPSPLK